MILKTATISYPIFIQPVAELGNLMVQTRLKGKAFLISDKNVYALHGAAVEKSLKEAGFQISSYQIPPGEENKTLQILSSLYDWLLSQKPERESVIVALGGGVVGDLAGFAAATILRGIPYVQVSTSLLAMVDSSVGGKTAVDHPLGKNLIGVFYQPSMVCIDPAFLQTLPKREFISGWAEVIRYSLISDAGFFRFLEENIDALLLQDKTVIKEAILHSVKTKAGIVGSDERETAGKRILLNYGHTIAHGLETATGYKRFLHGEVVAIGMVGAGRISQKLGMLGAEEVAVQESLLQRYGLPVSCKNIDKRAVLRAMTLDKKVRSGKIQWVLLSGLGKAVLRDDVPLQLVEQVLDRLWVS